MVKFQTWTHDDALQEHINDQAPSVESSEDLIDPSDEEP